MEDFVIVQQVAVRLHQIMMSDLVKESGVFRSRGIRVIRTSSTKSAKRYERTRDNSQRRI